MNIVISYCTYCTLHVSVTLTSLDIFRVFVPFSICLCKGSFRQFLVTFLLHPYYTIYIVAFCPFLSCDILSGYRANDLPNASNLFHFTKFVHYANMLLSSGKELYYKRITTELKKIKLPLSILTVLNRSMLPIFAISYNIVRLQSYMEIYQQDELPKPKTMLRVTAEASNFLALEAAKEIYVNEMDRVCYFQTLSLLLYLSLSPFLSIYLSISLSFFLSFSLSLSLSPFLTLSLFLSFSLSFSLPLSFSLC